MSKNARTSTRQKAHDSSFFKIDNTGRAKNKRRDSFVLKRRWHEPPGMDWAHSMVK